MAGRFIPDDNAKFADVAQTWATTLAKDPARFAISARDAEMLIRAVQAFQAARARRAPRPPGSGNTPSPLEEARQKAEAIVRRLAKKIRANDQISDAEKAMLHLYPRNPRPSDPGPPTTRPMLRFAGAIDEGGYTTSGQHVLEFGQRPDIRGRFPRQKKPPGVVRIELFVDLVPEGQSIPRYPGEFLGGRPWYWGSYTTNPIRVFPPTPPVSMLVVYWGRWADAKCRVGPFSQTCRARVEGWGGIAADALLGPMPDVKQLANDPKYITTITQLRQFEQVTVQPMLSDGRDGAGAPRELPGPAGTAAAPPKQLPMTDAA